MDFEPSAKVRDLQARLTAFMAQHVYPAEAVYAAEVAANRAHGNPWVATAVMEELKAKAKAASRWPTAARTRCCCSTRCTATWDIPKCRARPGPTQPLRPPAR